MVISSGIVIVGVYGELKGLNANTGDMVWENSLKGFGYNKFSFADLGSSVVVALGKRLFRIDPNNGTIIDAQASPLFAKNLPSALLVVNKLVIQGCSGKVMAFSIEDLSTALWINSHLGSPGFGNGAGYSLCSYQDTYVFVGTHRYLGCLKISSGELVWKKELPGQCQSR